MTDSRPAPLVPSGVDLRDTPIPREFFAQLAVTEFGIPIEVARAFVNETADRIENRRPRRLRRRR